MLSLTATSDKISKYPIGLNEIGKKLELPKNSVKKQEDLKVDKKPINKTKKT